MRGLTLPRVKRINRHETLQMVERYIHQIGEQIRATTDKLQSRNASGSFARHDGTGTTQALPKTTKPTNISVAGFLLPMGLVGGGS